MASVINQKASLPVNNPGPTSGTIATGQTQPFLVPEGFTLFVKSVNGAGQVVLVDPDKGGDTPKQTWAVAVGASFSIPAMSGTQKLLVSATTNSLDVQVGNAVLAAPTSIVTNDNSPALRTPDGLLRNIDNRRARTLTVYYDSEAGFGEATQVVTSITNNGDGTATATKGSSFGSYVGEPIRTYGAASKALNILDSSVVEILNSGNSVRFSLGGRSHPVISSVPSVIWPQRRTVKSFVTWMEAFLGVSLKTTWCAVPGASSTDILALSRETTFTEQGDVGIVGTGMNDDYAREWSLDQCFAAVTALIDESCRANKTTVVVSVMPRDSSDTVGVPPPWTSAKQAIHVQLNYLVSEYAKSKGCIWIDSWSLMNLNKTKTWVNAAATNPDPDVDFVVDKLHMSIVGALALGKALADRLAPLMGFSGWNPAHSYAQLANSGNLITDSDFSSGANVPTGWTWTPGTLTSSTAMVSRTVAADGDAAGRNFVATISGAGTGQLVKTGFHTALASYVGKKIQFKVPCRLTGSTGVSALGVTLFGTLPNGQSWQVYSGAIDGGTDVLVGDLPAPMTLMTVPVVVPAGLTALNIRVDITTTAAQTGNLILTLFKPDIHIVA